MGKHKTKREHTTSSGNHLKSRVRRDIRRTKMKINRWRRYQAKQKLTAKNSPRKNWNISGLESHLTNLEKLMKR